MVPEHVVEEVGFGLGRKALVPEKTERRSEWKNGVGKNQEVGKVYSSSEEGERACGSYTWKGWSGNVSQDQNLCCSRIKKKNREAGNSPLPPKQEP
jgi:hypothetical protein